MEDCELHRRPQAWKEVILPPKILPADLATVLFREVVGVNCGKTAISRCV